MVNLKDMLKDTKTKVIGAGLLAGLALFGGHKAITTQKYPTNMISGVQSETENGENNKYKLETQKVYDDTLFTWDISNTNIDTSQYLPIAFSKKSEGKREYDLSTGKTNIIPGPAYVPKKLENIESLSLGDIDVYEEPLSFTKENGTNLRTAQSTNEDLHYSIETMNLHKQGQYFFPHVEDNDSTKNALPFYIIPFKTSKLTIEESCKNLSLSNSKQGIYRPIIVDSLNINSTRSIKNTKKVTTSSGRVTSKK